MRAIEQTRRLSGADAPGARLWRNRNFNIFWAGQTLSVLGDSFALIALPLLVLQATGSVAQMGLVTGAYGVGQLAAGLFAGTLADRLDRRRLMIACDMARALLYATIPLGWWLGSAQGVGAPVQMLLIYAVTVLGAALGMCFQVAYITAVANLVDRDLITEANGRLQATFGLSFVLGPMLAGLVSARFGPPAAIGVNAVSFLASALSLSMIRLRRAAAAPPAERQPLVLEQLSAGARFLLRQPVLRAVTLLFLAFTLVAAGGRDLFIYYLKHDLGQNDAAVGVVFGMASVGSILGALLAPTLRRRWGFGACFLGGMLLEGVVLLLIGYAPGVAFVAAEAMGFTFGDSVRGINSMSLRQQITPDHLLGRVTAAFWTLVNVPGPLGAGAVTALAAQIGAPLVLALMGVAGLAIGLAGMFTPARAAWPEAQAGSVQA
jgi:MFS family permease